MKKTMYLSKSQSLIYAANLDADNKLKDPYTNYLWNFGLLLALCLIIQIITHVTLSMHYTPNVLEGFDSVEYVAKEVNLYSLVKSLHTYTASAFFLLVYLHISRGSYYGSYEAPRTLTWTIATVIFILMMATAFLGYVLPYGQISLWGATVITNLISAIPWIGLEPSKINLCVNVIIIFAQFYLFNSIYKGSYKQARTYKYLKIKSIKLFSFYDKYANLVKGLNKGFTTYFNIWSLLKKQVKSLFLKVRFDIFSPFFLNLILPNLLCFTIVLNIELFCLTINYTFKFFYLITIYHKIIITISPIYVMPILIGFVLYKFIQFICIIFSIIQSSSIVSALTFNLSIYYYPYLKKDEFNNLRFFISIFILIFIMFYVFLLLFNLCVIINKFIIFMNNGTVYMSGRGRGELPDLNNSNESGPSNPNKRPFTEMEGASLEEENRKKRQKRKAEYNYLTLLVGLTDSSPSLDSINASFPDLSSNEKIYANNFNLEGPSNILSSGANLSSTPIIAEQSNTSSGNITTPSVIPEQNNSGLRNPLHSYYSRPHNSVTSSVNIPSIYTNLLHYNLGIPSANAMDTQPIDPQLIDPQLINPQLSSNTGTSTVYNPSIIPMQSNIGMSHVNPMNAQLSINTRSNGGNVEPISITSAPNLTHSNTNISTANQSTINLLQRSTQNTAYTEQDIRDHISRINLPKNSVLDKPIFCHSVWHSKNVLWFVGDFSKSNLEAICKGTDLARCNIIEWSSSPKKLGIDLLKNQYTFMVRENRQGVAVSDIGLWTDHILTNKSNRIERLDGNRVFIETYTKHRS